MEEMGVVNMGNKFGKLCAFLLLAVLEFAILTAGYVIIEDYVRYPRTDDLIDRIVALAVVIVVGIVIPAYVVCWNIYTGKASNWEYTYATLTGHEEMYQEYVVPGSNPRTARKYRQYKDIQIKYTVNNREYIKYVKMVYIYNFCCWGTEWWEETTHIPAIMS